METNALLFATVYEQNTLARMTKASAALPRAQADYFMAVLSATSSQRIDRLAAGFLGETVVYGPFGLAPGRAVI